MSEPLALVCKRIADGEPSVQSVVDKCGWCGAAVWRALSSPTADAIICMPCITEQDPDHQKRAQPPTEAQLRDIARLKR